MRITSMRKITTAAAALSAAALTLGLAGAAHAELYGIDDPDDISHGSDILAMQVRNGHENLTVTTIHSNLRRDPATGSGGAIFVDTDANDSGPEYVMVAGYFDGTDYQLLETEGFAPSKWGDPVENGDYILRVDYAKDRVRVRISRPALGNPDAVRLAVRASGSHGPVDWVSQRQAFTPWIDRG